MEFDEWDLTQNIYDNKSDKGNDSESDNLEEFSIRNVVPFRISLIILYSMAFILCVTGNFAVILVVSVYWKMRTITNFFIANLAFADFCVGIFCIFQNLYLILGNTWILGSFLCKMYFYVNEMSHTVFPIILVLIFIEKYLAIIHPLIYKDWLTTNRLRVTILSTWTLSGIYAFSKSYYAEAKTHSSSHVHDSKEKEEEAICTLNLTKHNSDLYDMIQIGLLYMLPLLIIAVLYYKIRVALWKPVDHQQISTVIQHKIQNNIVEIDDNGFIRRKSDLIQAEFSCSNILCCCNYVKKSCCYNKLENPDVELVQMTHNDLPRHEFSLILHNNEMHGSHALSTYSSTRHSQLSENLNARESRKQTGTRKESKICETTVKIRESKSASSKTVKTKRRVIKMLSCIVICFTLCNLPYYGRKMWKILQGTNYNGSGNISKIFTTISFVTMYGASGLNPLLYLFLSKTFKKFFVDLFMTKYNFKRSTGKNSQ